MSRRRTAGFGALARCSPLRCRPVCDCLASDGTDRDARVLRSTHRREPPSSPTRVARRSRRRTRWLRSGRAAEAGADVLDADLHMTADGELVLIHDETVDRTSDGTGAVRDLTLSELRALDFGYRFSPDDGQTHPIRGRGVGIVTVEELSSATEGEVHTFYLLHPISCTGSASKASSEPATNRSRSPSTRATSSTPTAFSICLRRVSGRGGGRAPGPGHARMDRYRRRCLAG